MCQLNIPDWLCDSIVECSCILLLPSCRLETLVVTLDDVETPFMNGLF